MKRWGMRADRGRIEVLGQKRVTVTLFLAQISHGMTLDQAQAYMVTGPGLTPWVKAQPVLWQGPSHGTAWVMARPGSWQALVMEQPGS